MAKKHRFGKNGYKKVLKNTELKQVGPGRWQCHSCEYEIGFENVQDHPRNKGINYCAFCGRKISYYDERLNGAGYEGAAIRS